MKMLHIFELVDGAWYLGQHRETGIAVWDQVNQEFAYVAWGNDTVIKKAKHPEQPDSSPLFHPYERIQIPYL